MKLTTWNMQGSNHSTENKWNDCVNNIMRDTDMMCLQECGAVPASAELIEDRNDGIKRYSWGGTNRGNGNWILFYLSDPNGNRCNLAIVVRDKYTLDSMLLLNPDTPPIWRPLLGVHFNNATFFSLHAISPGGPDVLGLLTAASTHGGRNWIAAGDFNRSPENNFPAGNWNVCSPSNNTYPATDPAKQLDFCVTSERSVQGEVLSLVFSDHLPVTYTFA